MTARRSPAADVEALCKLMERYGVTELKCADIVLVRPPFALVKDEKAGAEQRDEFDRIKGMSPDQQDRALGLGSLGPVGAG